MTNTQIAALERALAERREAGLFRTRRMLDSAQGARVVIDGRPVLAFASNDYLGLANDPAIVAAARRGAKQWGAGAGASHLVSGHQRPHASIESALAQFVSPCAGAQGLLFSTGYLANLAVLTTLAGRGDAIFSDKLNHASLIDGARLSGAECVRYPHGDLEALEQRLRSSSAARKIIATDAVFSMDGDIAPLPALLDLAERYDALVHVDDAHGFGVLGEGRGSLAHFGIASERIVYIGTLGKAAGVAGAFVAAHATVIETLVQFGRTYIYTTAMPAMLACALEASLGAIRAGRDRREQLQRLVSRLRERSAALRWTMMPSSTPIQPLLVGRSDAAVALSKALWDRGIYIPGIRPPTVPEGTARLRISLTASHTETDIDELIDALRNAA